MQRTCRGVAVDTEVESIRVIAIFLTIRVQAKPRMIVKKYQKRHKSTIFIVLANLDAQLTGIKSVPIA